ncbi:hypothetical protein [Dyadobacter sp. CY356]|uniref:hypothetical protein n=1 Tax=Dyadobacter sp. CY356 TaxID=2906442 RepID=UPI001F39D9A7|nr:hypothetical protein [Dyadobacter sp. CY356]MCF0057017.1 hypothetical protein [Dyadobacter sp. CY356]
MKSILLACLSLFILSSCQKDKNEVVVQNPVDTETPVENPDWYILTAPDARPIEGVYGDIDKSIVITTGFKIYKTDDKGKTWQVGNYDKPIGIFSFTEIQDTLLVFNTKSYRSDNTKDRSIYATRPSFYSIDKGISWFPYENITYTEKDPSVLLNKAFTQNGTEYKIDQVTTDGYVETVGVITSTGQKISLPQNHQIQSLYFDKKDRLYVSASAAVCGTGNNFSWCKGENGVLYISKLSKK